MSKKQEKQAKQASKKRHSAIPPKAKPVAKAEHSAVATMEAPVVALKTVEAKIEVAAPIAPVMAAIPAAPSGPSEKALQLINQLRDLDAGAASDAAIELGTLGEAFAVPSLIQVIENVDGYFHSVVRAAASSSLGQLKDARAIDALGRAIDDEMAEASAEAVRALAAIGDGRAVSALVPVVRNIDGYYSPVVRRAAVIALAHLGGPIAMAELKTVAADESEDAVIRHAAQSN